jgi:hypothetical protein
VLGAIHSRAGGENFLGGFSLEEKAPGELLRQRKLGGAECWGRLILGLGGGATGGASFGSEAGGLEEKAPG